MKKMWALHAQLRPCGWTSALPVPQYSYLKWNTFNSSGTLTRVKLTNLNTFQKKSPGPNFWPNAEHWQQLYTVSYIKRGGNWAQCIHSAYIIPTPKQIPKTHRKVSTKKISKGSSQYPSTTLVFVLKNIKGLEDGWRGKMLTTKA